VPFVTGGQDVLRAESWYRSAEGGDLFFDMAQPILPLVRIRNEAGNRPAVPGDHDGLAALNLAQKLRQMRLGV
jgi:hypothetical protein